MLNGYAPTSFDEALAIRSFRDAVPYAGGTSSMNGTSNEKKLLFLNNIESIKKVWQDQDSIYIGACCTFEQLLSEKLVPWVLKKVIEEIGTEDIRKAGTIGGNICSASPGADTLPVLYALNVMVVLRDIEEKEILSIEEFITGVNKTRLKKNQLLQYIIIPKQNCTNYYYKKIGGNLEDALPKLSFVGIVRTERGVVKRISIAYGSAGDTVIRDRILEEKLTGITAEQLKMRKDEIISDYSGIVNPKGCEGFGGQDKKDMALKILAEFIDTIK